jgi:hypothetical protein
MKLVLFLAAGSVVLFASLVCASFLYGVWLTVEERRQSRKNLVETKKEPIDGIV